MKTFLSLALVSAALTTSGCFTYEQRTVPNRVVVQETAVSPAPQRVVTVLPTGYRTRVYRGDPYYYYTTTSIIAGIRAAATQSLSGLGRRFFWKARPRVARLSRPGPGFHFGGGAPDDFSAGAENISQGRASGLHHTFRG